MPARVERAVIRLLRPVVWPPPVSWPNFTAIGARAAGRRQQRQQRRPAARAGDVNLAACRCGSTMSKFTVEGDPVGRHRRCGDERPGALQPLLLGIEGDEDQRVRVRRCHAALGHGQQHRHARGVVVGAVIGLPVADAEVIVVRRHDDHRHVAATARARGDEVGAVHGRAGLGS